MRFAFATVLLVATTSIASAQAPGQTMSWEPEAAPPSAAVPQTITVSYRGQVLLSDGLSLGLVFAGAYSDNPLLSVTGMTGYLVAAPIVHIAHGRGTAALGSFGLRAGLPMIGSMLGNRIGPRDTGCAANTPDGGFQQDDSRCNDGSRSGLLVGALVGVAAAIVVDTKYLAKYERHVAVPSWTASINPIHGGVNVGVSGSF
jgi:hypothetical protein